MAKKYGTFKEQTITPLKLISEDLMSSKEKHNLANQVVWY